MVIYVESNFVLEISLVREEAAFANALLRLAEDGHAALVVPSFALSEPFSTVDRRGNERSSLCNALRQQLRELRRSGPHQELAAGLSRAIDGLVQANAKERDLLQETITRVMQSAHIIDLDLHCFNESLSYTTRFGLSAQDAIVYASIISDLSMRDVGEEKCFVSLNFRDFDDPDIGNELRSYGCRYIVRFRDAEQFVRSRLGGPTTI